MDETIRLAAIFGPFLTLVGIWALWHHNAMVKAWSSVKSTPGVLYLGAMINLIIGFTILTVYHEWSMDFRVVLTIFGWLISLRGFLVLFYPEVVIDWTMSRMKSVKWVGIIPLVMGLILSWLAYVQK